MKNKANKSTEVNKSINRRYIVTDYSRTIGEFEKLKDARECMKKRGGGSMCAIESVTIETIVIESRHFIQHLR
jgi:hypothetical protein